MQCLRRNKRWHSMEAPFLKQKKNLINQRYILFLRNQSQIKFQKRYT